jgi:hypothetical protein
MILETAVANFLRLDSPETSIITDHKPVAEYGGVYGSEATKDEVRIREAQRDRSVSLFGLVALSS